MEFDYKKYEAQEKAREKLRKIDEEFANAFGRKYGLIEAYRCNDADAIVVAMGTMVGTAKDVADRLRKDKGWKVGVLKIRSYRPFPRDEVLKVVSGSKAVAVINRAISYGIGAPVFSDVASAVSNAAEKPVLLNFIAGMGGRDVDQKGLTAVFEKSMKAAETGRFDHAVDWVGLNTNLVGG
jgi:pyruvate ferredoxin oxidoreductase alpha subunit